MPADLIIFVILIAVFAIAGIRVGMLVSGRLGRMADRLDEEVDDGDD